MSKKFVSDVYHGPPISGGLTEILAPPLDRSVVTEARLSAFLLLLL